MKANQVACICERCGAAFSVKASRAQRGGGKFCSLACTLGPRINTAQAFWARVDQRGLDDCWLWTGSVSRATGYGRFKPYGRSSQGAHRVAWERTHGPIPEGLLVCHECDHRYAPNDITYRRCVNPAHLILGTQSENIAHAVDIGRAPTGDNHYMRAQPARAARMRGSGNPVAKLTAEAVHAIRQHYGQGGITLAALAKDHGISTQTVFRIVHRRAWGWMP